jgi:hypothetical protein
MPDSTRIFGIYPTSQQAEAAVDRLLEAEFAGWAISVLHPDNQNTREFAERKNTRPPEGTAHGKTASVPLDGTLGLLHPGAGPVEGALSAALAGMGVPADWDDRRVVHGKVLLVVECLGTDQAAKASEILKNSEAEDVDSVVIQTHGHGHEPPPENPH